MEGAGKIQTSIGQGKILFARVRGKARQGAQEHVAEGVRQ